LEHLHRKPGNHPPASQVFIIKVLEPGIGDLFGTKVAT
jgi:hypothetical protein